MIEYALNIIILLILPFVFIGVINKTKAFWGGRKGAPIMQPLYDFIKLIKKGEIISTTTCFVFDITPSLTFSCIVFASLIMPLVNHQSLISFEGDFILFAYVLSLGKFFSLISAMDTGSSFEGMGASREACFSTLVEPAFFMTIASVSALSGCYSFESFFTILQNSGDLGYLIIILSIIMIFLMLLVEGCRVPVDDPKTHLELTMIHEVMVLDNSGPDLAFITYGNSIKMLLFSALIANLIIPSSYSLLVSIFCFIGIILGLAALIGTIESSIARFRMTRLFEFIFLMSSASLIILALSIMVIHARLVQ